MRKITFIIAYIIFDDNLKINPVSFFTADFSLLNCEFDSFTYKLLYCVIFILIKIKLFYDIVFTKLLQFLVKIHASSIIIQNLVFPAPSKFAVKLIC